MIELADPCNVRMLFLRGDVKRLLRFLGIQILQGYIAAPLLHIGWVVAAAWRTGCKTTRHLTDCVATVPCHTIACLHGPWSPALAKDTAQPSFHIRRACGRHEMSYHLRMS